jgi:hypothetical protein
MYSVAVPGASRATPILLYGPDLLVEWSRVTHLRYQVRRS